ncbi:HofP DNA utilization family protein [Enterobacter soli]|uniref:HofP DNA utilization family protein n=1 Tax=Enterobacter soli TaxID=885040 RepID=UPI0034CE347E
MHTSLRYLIVGSVLLLTGMRDPFHPPPDRCAAGQLAQWRYHGSVNRVGLLQDGQHRWHRVKAGDRLPVGWRVMSVEDKALTIALNAACEPTQWQWQREGTKNESRDNAVADNAQQPGVGGSAKAGHAGGG